MDKQLKQEVITAMIVLCAVAIAFSIMSSKGYQRRVFLNDCGEPVEYCEMLWELGNG